MKPQNFEERVIWYAIVGTYGLYLIGGQPIIVPAIAWLLALYACKKIWDQKQMYGELVPGFKLRKLFCIHKHRFRSLYLFSKCNTYHQNAWPINVR